MLPATRSGRISGVTTKKDALASPVTLASSVLYHPFGQVKSFTYGNNLVFTKTVTQDYLINTLKVADTTTATNILDRTYGFTDNINLTGFTDNLTAAQHRNLRLFRRATGCNAAAASGARSLTAMTASATAPRRR